MKKNIIYSIRFFLVVILFVEWGCAPDFNHFSEDSNEYLKYNSVALDVSENEDYFTFSMIDPYLEEIDIFFTGEQHHATKKNFDVRFKFLKYFIQKGDIRYYLNESGYGSTYIINKYLENGNEDHLKKFMNPLKGTYDYSIETEELWKKVRAYNLSVEKNQRIIAVGVDVDHQVDTAIFALYLLLPEGSDNKPQYIDKIKELYNELNNNDFKRENYRIYIFRDIKTLIMNLSQELEKNENVYREYLGKNMFDFKMIVDNIINTYSYYESGSKKKIREKSMYNNFIKVYNNLPKSIPKKFFGQWGSFHIYQESSENSNYGSESFTTMLQHRDESPVKGKILSIDMCYYNSYYLDRESGEPRYIYEKEYIFDLLELSLGDVTLFKLISENSPFEKEIYFINSEMEVPGTVTTDYFQFIILIKNSDAVRPWE